MLSNAASCSVLPNKYSFAEDFNGRRHVLIKFSFKICFPFFFSLLLRRNPEDQSAERSASPVQGSFSCYEHSSESLAAPLDLLEEFRESFIMVRPSNPRFMSRVLDAVTRLSEGKGSSARDVLAFVRQNSSPPARNLTMQVHRALKHAVNAGLLRLKSGRYKALVAVNPIRANLHHADDVNNCGLKINADTEDLPFGDPSRRIQERRGRRRRRSRGRRRRSAGRRRRRSRHRRHRRRTTPEERTRKMRQDRRKGVEEEVEEWAVPRRKSHAEDLEGPRNKGRRATGSSAEGATYSDDSVGGAEYEDSRKISKSKRVSQSPRRGTRRRTRSSDRKSERRTGRRSSSRHRSQQQLPMESALQSSGNGMECDEVPANSVNNEERRNKNSQEEGTEQNGEPENCASGSDL